MKLIENYSHAMERKFAKDYLISPSTLGVSANPMKDLVQGVKARIFQGAQHIELGFSGRGKGSMYQSATTPEMYGKEEREAIRDMAKINKVTLSTHATISVGNFSGFHEGRFDEQLREQNLFEAKRALEFAADVAGGGPVVVHTGEFPREISEAPSPEKYGIKETYILIAKTLQDIFLRNQKFHGAGGVDIKKAKGTWINEVRLIFEADKRTIEDFRKVVKYLKDSYEFWTKVIFSPSKLRKHFDTLLINYNDWKKRKLSSTTAEQIKKYGYVKHSKGTTDESGWENL